MVREYGRLPGAAVDQPSGDAADRSFALAGTWARAALIVGLVTSTLAMLVALLSLGTLLAPTVAATALVLVVTRPAHTYNGRLPPRRHRFRPAPVG